MRKRTLAASAMLLLATTVVGCSSSDGNKGDGDGDNGVKGISVLTLTDNGRVVRVYNPKNGKLVMTRYFSLGKEQRTLASCSNPGELSAFTPDYNGLAAATPFGSGYHVGILTATDGPQKVSKFKDLSGDAKAKGKPVSQSPGAFGPDGKLYALEQSQAGLIVKVIDPASGKAESLNTQPSWKEQDESGNEVTRNAQVRNPEDAEEDAGAYKPTKPYFLSRGKGMEVDPSGHKVYSADAKWAFETPDDAHVTRGNLQTATGERYTVDMPEQPDGAVDPVSPVLVINQDKGVFVSQYGPKMYTGEFVSGEELKLDPLDVGKNDHIGQPVAAPDNKGFAFVNSPQQGTDTLHVFALNGAAAKAQQSIELPTDGDSCVLGWR